MMRVLLVSNGPDALVGLEQGLCRCSDMQVLRVNSGLEALEKIKGKDAAIDLLVVDQVVEDVQGLKWVEQMVALNPMVNTALVSDLSDEDFHEYTEGLGVLMRIPPNSDETTATQVVERLSKVLNLNKNLGA